MIDFLQDKTLKGKSGNLLRLSHPAGLQPCADVSVSDTSSLSTLRQTQSSFGDDQTSMHSAQFMTDGDSSFETHSSTPSSLAPERHTNNDVVFDDRASNGAVGETAGDTTRRSRGRVLPPLVLRWDGAPGSSSSSTDGASPGTASSVSDREAEVFLSPLSKEPASASRGSALGPTRLLDRDPYTPSTPDVTPMRLSESVTRASSADLLSLSQEVESTIDDDNIDTGRLDVSDHVLDILRKDPEQRTPSDNSRIAQDLERFPVFADLPDALRRRLFSLLEFQTYDASNQPTNRPDPFFLLSAPRRRLESHRRRIFHPAS